MIKLALATNAHRQTPSPPTPRRYVTGVKLLAFVPVTALLTVSAIALAATETAADDLTWHGDSDDDWFNPQNWNADVVPTSSDTVVLPVGRPLIDADDALANSVTITGHTLLDVNNVGIGGLGKLQVIGQGPGYSDAGEPTVVTGARFYENASTEGISIDLKGTGDGISTNAAVQFHDTSSAANSRIDISGQTQLVFYDYSTAGSATIVNNDAGVAFVGRASAGAAHIVVNNSGKAVFANNSTADNATISNNASGVVDISPHELGITIGSLSGAGNVYLGGNSLAVGARDANDTISGVIADGISPQEQAYRMHLGLKPSSETGGSLVKVGSGNLTLTGDNTYTGGTSFRGGQVEVFRDSNLGASSGGLNFNGGVLHTTASFATDRTTTLHPDGGIFDIASGTHLTQTGTISGEGNLTKTGGGRLTVAGANDYTGVTRVMEGAFAAGAINSFGAGSVYIVDEEGELDLAGFDQRIAGLDNAGLVSLKGGVPGTRLEIADDYAGRGGTISFNTELGGDRSKTDHVVISGGASGVGNVQVANAGGVGAPTVEGIRIIEIAGSSDAIFALSGDYVIEGQQAVVGGAYAYTLNKNGIATPTDGDWYLRSQLAVPADPVPPVAPTGPIYQAGVPVYEAYPQVLQSLNGLPTLQQRVGNRYWLGEPVTKQTVFCKDFARNLKCPVSEEQAGYSAGQGGTIEQNAIWGRIEGRRSVIEPDVSISSASYNIDTFKAQAGIDGQLYESDTGRLIGGITAHYGRAQAGILSFYGNGDIDTDGYGFGGTLTWYGANGFYVDAQSQATWYDNHLNSRLAGLSLVDGNNGFGYALSLEAGKGIDLGDNWTITPQAQLIYSVVDFDSFTDPFGARVSLENGESLKGRLGIALEHQDSWESESSQTSRSKVYGIANLYNEFLDGSRVDIAGTKFTSREDRLWGGIAIGGSYNWADDKYSIYGEASINTSLSNFADSYSVKGTAGFRVKW